MGVKLRAGREDVGLKLESPDAHGVYLPISLGAGKHWWKFLQSLTLFLGISHSCLVARLVCFRTESATPCRIPNRPSKGYPTESKGSRATARSVCRGRANPDPLWNVAAGGAKNLHLCGGCSEMAARVRGLSDSCKFTRPSYDLILRPGALAMNSMMLPKPSATMAWFICR